MASKNVLHEVLDESDVLVVNGGTHDDQLGVKCETDSQYLAMQENDHQIHSDSYPFGHR